MAIIMSQMHIYGIFWCANLMFIFSFSSHNKNFWTLHKWRSQSFRGASSQPNSTQLVQRLNPGLLTSPGISWEWILIPLRYQGQWGGEFTSGMTACVLQPWRSKAHEWPWPLSSAIGIASALPRSFSIICSNTVIYWWLLFSIGMVWK